VFCDVFVCVLGKKLISIFPLGAGIGVFSTETLPRGVRFGPYCGREVDTVENGYCWTVSTYLNWY
jgi:hypothetical protein